MRAARVLLAPVFGTILLGGCDLTRTRYNRPPIVFPEVYEHANGDAKAIVDRWWQSFGDSRLDMLIDEAVRSNDGLGLAVLNVRAAQLQRHLAVINPTVSVGYTYDYTKSLVGSFPATRFHSLTPSAGYEVDLWDQLESQKEVAKFEALATEQDWRSAALILTGSVVSLYYQIASLNQRIALGEQSTAYAQKTLDLVKVLAEGGAASTLEIVQSEQTLRSNEAAQIDLIQQRVEARSDLAIILNGTHWPERAEAATVPDEPPPAVDSGLPASLLDRRPDLQAAELRLRQTLAQMDATRLSFYPNLSLTGSLGAASTGLSELVSNPLGSLAIILTTPFVQFNESRFATALARVQYEKAVIVFRETLLQALIEVDNALSARTQLANEGVRLDQSLEAAKSAEHLYEIRYRAGAVSLRTWFDAQENRRQAEVSLITNRLNRLQNYATLCQALGGGTVYPK